MSTCRTIPNLVKTSRGRSIFYTDISQAECCISGNPGYFKIQCNGKYLKKHIPSITVRTNYYWIHARVVGGYRCKPYLRSFYSQLHPYLLSTCNDQREIYIYCKDQRNIDFYMSSPLTNQWGWIDMDKSVNTY